MARAFTDVGIERKQIWGRGRGMAGEARRANGVGSLVVACVITSTMPQYTVCSVKSTTLPFIPIVCLY